MFLSRLRFRKVKSLRVIALIAALFIALAATLLFHLNTNPTGLSSVEVSTYHSSQSLSQILHNPLNAPFRLDEYIITHISSHSIAWLRLTSVISGFLAGVLIFLIAKAWHGWLAGAVAVSLLGTSSVLLHLSRLNSPAIVLVLGLLALVECGIWLTHSRRRSLAALVGIAVCGFALYFPGLIWFVILGLIWQRESIKYELSRLKPWYLVGLSLFGLILVAPLIYGLSYQPSLALAAVGLPNHLPSLQTIGERALHLPLSLFVKNNYDPVFFLGHLPILNIFEDAMLVLGCWYLWLYRQLDRSKLLFGVLVLGSLLNIFAGTSLALLVPVVYLIITSGVVGLYRQWLKVFPKNPIARSLGIIVIFVAIATSCFFHLREYFVAWQQSPTTSATFNQKLPPISGTIKSIK